MQKNYFTFEKKLNGNNVYKIKNNKELNDIKEIFETELLKIFKKELNIKVNPKHKIYDHEKWDSLRKFQYFVSCRKTF